MKDFNKHAISIHAPAWGATVRNSLGLCGQLISIHAPAWGATQNVDVFQRSFSNFNPRTRVGCDHHLVFNARRAGFQSTHPRGVRRFSFSHGRAVQPISIHAPAWGATSFSAGDLSNSVISIHAPAWGATNLRWTCFPCRCQFQSTHPRGVRLHNVTTIWANSKISIHAPAWGATIDLLEQVTVVSISIHAPAWGAT